MNEFEQELQRITDLLGQYRNEDLTDDSQWMSPHDAREAIKQAIEKHIIGEQDPNPYSHDPEKVYWGKQLEEYGKFVRERQRQKLRS